MAIVLSMLVASQGYAEDQKAKNSVGLPIIGLKARCCDTAVEGALRSMRGVESAAIRKEAGRKVAVLGLREGATIELSKVQEALARASKNMGDSMSMAMNYEVDSDSLTVDDGVCFRIKRISDADKVKLDKELGKLEGWQLSKAVVPSSKDQMHLFLRFQEGRAPSVTRCRKAIEASGVTVLDVLLQGTSTTTYRCSMDGGERATPGPCPKCGMKLGEESKVVAGSEAPSKQPPSKERYTCPMCGGDFDAPGDCPKCGMALTEKQEKKGCGDCCK